MILVTMTAGWQDWKLNGWLSSLPHSSRIDAVRRAFERCADLLLAVEPIWVLLAAAFVYLSHLLELGTALPWIGLALAVLPFPVRRIRQGYLRLSTDFDLPLSLLIGGALFGLIVSPKFDLSLGAFQCMLAVSLVYYSAVNLPQLASMMKWLIAAGLLGVLGNVIFVCIEVAGASDGSASAGSTYHGLALALLIVAAILTGVAVFGSRGRVRVAIGLLSLCLYVVIIVLVQESVPRLFTWETVSGRLPRWGTTIDMLMDSPFTGVGLGCWAYVYHGTEVLTHPTHVHNSYLELYANTGILGALSLVLLLAIALKVGVDIIRSSRDHPWYGFGIGVLIACVATLLVGVVESAPIGVPLVGADDYSYIISPAPWILVALLAISHRLICGRRALDRS